MRRSLATRFAIAGGLVLGTAALLIGSWVTNRIEDSVVRNTANGTAIYMESFISPISQQLASSDELSPGARRALEEIFTNTPLGERVVSYKIWKPGGLVVEAADKSLIGRRFEPTAGLRAAWKGEVSANFEELGDAEDEGEQALGLPLLEIYSPIREVWSGDVIAVAEFYELNPELKADLIAARRQAWVRVVGAVVGLGSILYAIVLGGSRTIDRQRRTLDARLADLQEMAERNRELRLRVQGAASRTAAAAEQSLRRIGADLHDGPAQYLAYAALRLDGLRKSLPDGGAHGDLDAVRDSVAQAMAEVRAISRGMSLPDIAERPLAELLADAVEAHRARTGDEVALSLGRTLPDPDHAQRICVFRFVQEGLNNASRHAGGAALEVEAQCEGGRLSVAVRDRGPGLPERPEERPGLGLSGLRDRVESLGGTFITRSRAGGGCELIMCLDTGAMA